MLCPVCVGEGGRNSENVRVFCETFHLTKALKLVKLILNLRGWYGGRKMRKNLGEMIIKKCLTLPAPGIDLGTSCTPGNCLNHDTSGTGSQIAKMCSPFIKPVVRREEFTF